MGKMLEKHYLSSLFFGAHTLDTALLLEIGFMVSASLKCLINISSSESFLHLSIQGKIIP